MKENFNIYVTIFAMDQNFDNTRSIWCFAESKIFVYIRKVVIELCKGCGLLDQSELSNFSHTKGQGCAAELRANFTY